MYRQKLKGLLLITLLMIVACAPADLDITPTMTSIPLPTATPTPNPEASAEIAIEATPEVEASAGGDNEAMVNAILEAVPANIAAGAIQWRYNASNGSNDVLTTVINGYVQEIDLTEQQGSQATVTFGVFDTPEDAQVYFDTISELRDAFSRAEPDENFPEPNLFGSGTYGSGAIFLQDNIFIEVALVVISSTAGDAVRPLARQALRIVEDGLANSDVTVDESPTPEAIVETVMTNEDIVGAILGSVPSNIASGAIQWRYNAANGSNDVLTTVVNGYVQEIDLTEQQGSQATLTFGAFNTPEDAQVYFDMISELRDAFSRAEPDENFPEPNLFGSGTYGSGAIFLQDNIFIEVALVVISSTAGDAVRPLARQALRIVENASVLTSSGDDADNADEEGGLTFDALLESLPSTVGDFRRNNAPTVVDSDHGDVATARYTGVAGITLTLGVFASADDVGSFVGDELERGAETLTAQLEIGEMTFVIVSIDGNELDLFQELIAHVEAFYAQ